MQLYDSNTFEHLQLINTHVLVNREYLLERERERETQAYIDVSRACNIIINQTVSKTADFKFSIYNTKKLHLSESFGWVEFFVLRPVRAETCGKNTAIPANGNFESRPSACKTPPTESEKGFFAYGKASASVESRAQHYGKVSASVESSAQCYGKVSASVESRAHRYGKVSASIESSAQYYGRFSAAPESSAQHYGRFSANTNDNNPNHRMLKKHFIHNQNL